MRHVMEKGPVAGTAGACATLGTPVGFVNRSRVVPRFWDRFCLATVVRIVSSLSESAVCCCLEYAVRISAVVAFTTWTVGSSYTTLSRTVAVADTLSLSSSSSSCQIANSLSTPASSASYRAVCFSPRNVLVVGNRLSVSSGKQVSINQEGNVVRMFVVLCRDRKFEYGGGKVVLLSQVVPTASLSGSLQYSQSPGSTVLQEPQIDFGLQYLRAKVRQLYLDVLLASITMLIAC
jgi:hypothetical protein